MIEENQRQQEYWNQRLCRHWGPEGVGSVVYGRQFNRWRYRVRARVFRRLVRLMGLQPESLSVLDIGCGTGFYLEQWRALGVKHLAGLDISDWAIEQLANVYPDIALYRSDISAAESILPQGAFDVVCAMDVLTQVVDDDAYMNALKNIHYALNAGGYLIYSDSFFHGTDKQFEDYWKGRTLSFITAAMQDTGFEVVSRVPMSVLMAAPTDTRRRELYEHIWNKMMAPVRRSEWAGFLAGMLLYPLELLLVSILKESPAIEIMVCKKRP
ncbi:MAG TPA: class I SAM-dependent methyltransferase [Smithella sp.]|nr:class I SAM-dependent methyltransferase [Smithella sp.]